MSLLQRFVTALVLLLLALIFMPDVWFVKIFHPKVLDDKTWTGSDKDLLVSKILWIKYMKEKEGRDLTLYDVECGGYKSIPTKTTMGCWERNWDSYTFNYTKKNLGDAEK